MTSGEIVLSSEQRAAILTPGNLLVRAGAGSGKTEVLARRFVGLIAGDIAGREPLNPEQVAAITFTEKAAYDMRARIAAVLAARISADPDEERRSSLRRAQRRLPLARISTIHAFCARILRENALDAGLDPDFQVLDQYQSRTFLERLCRQALVEAVRKSDLGAVYLGRARRLESGTPREDALEIVMRILDEVARLGRSTDWLQETTRGRTSRLETKAGAIADMACELVRLLDELLAARLTPRAKEKIAPLRPRWVEYRSQILALNAQSEPSAFDFLRDLCACLPAAQGAIQDCVQSIRSIVNVSTASFGLGGELISAYGACRALPRALEVAETMREVSARVEHAKAEERVLTFDDLLVRTRDLLAGNATVAHRYRTGIAALLVDEYQDTDAVQDEIVAMLTDPRDKTVAAPELFIVGDEKQSIYRFRGADVTVFGRERRSSPASLTLLGNRRSAPNIVTFVNRIGASLMRSEERPVPAYWVEWGADHELNALRTPALDAPVEIITAIPDSISTPDATGTAAPRKLNAGRKRELEARALAARIHKLVDGETIPDAENGLLRPVRFRDIAILLRAFTDVAIYENALLDAGVPCYTVKGRGFFGCQEVLDLIELLTAVNDRDDSIALAAALRSPFLGVSDDCLAEIALHRVGIASAFATPNADFAWLDEGREAALRAWRILEELRKLRARGTIIQVIEHALAATGYEAVMLGLSQGRQRVANLRKLVELAREFESRRLFTFDDFVAHLRRLVEEEPYESQAQILGESENVVRLMTVHQAKGLEFPVVILADAGRGSPTDNRNPVVDPSSGLLVREVAGSGMDEISNREFDEFRKRARSEQEAEAARLLYVALTRARDRLIISEGAMLQGWAKQLRAFVGGETVKAFVSSNDERVPLDCAGAKVVLFRPEVAETRPPAVEGALPVDVIQFAELASRRRAFEPAYTRELVISPSALADFDRCPRQYRFRHGLKLPEGPDRDEKTVGGDAITMGTVAHAVLERLDFTTSGPNDVEIAQLVESLGPPAGLDSEQCSAIAADLAHYTAALPPNDQPMAREVPFFCHVGEHMFVRGQIDALVERDGLVIVRDYKYARAAEEAGIYQVQMEAYALAASDAFGGQRVEGEIVFLRGGHQTVPIGLATPERIRAQLLALGRRIVEAQEHGDYPRGPSNPGLCRQLRCGFVARCWGG
ncbi:MAG TPA: UvrD-helicase domain-containing protein [Candidatus Binataceae bacterium]|nr:UvrD-helicase domain-containing protein [Candidatus Binataceae bacterium]